MINSSIVRPQTVGNESSTPRPNNESSTPRPKIPISKDKDRDSKKGMNTSLVV